MMKQSSKRKTDRRVQRTRQLLQGALISLILEKGYDAVTVQDILDRANMGRSTFYAHYQDKQNLLLSGFQELLETFQDEYQLSGSASSDPAAMAKNLSLFFFRHARSHQGLFKAMIGEQGGKIIQDYLLKYVTQFIGKHLAEQLSDQQKQVPVELLAHFIASSYLSLISWWLDHNMPYSAEAMDRMFQQLVYPGVRSLIVSGQTDG